MTIDRIAAPEWTTKHGHFLQMGGFKLACTKEEGREVLMYKYQYQSRLGDDIWEGVLQSWDFRKLLEGHKIDFPSTSEAEIDD